MKHLGDITKIKGCAAPVVDCIIGGSPCQDLSVAGKRAGLAGERSGLYMEQIRIIKEMRHEDELRGRSAESIRPRYMVWENVPGAFSSNKGKDFAAVIEEAIRVAEPEAPDVPVPEKGWPTSGCIIDEMGKWSAAWRVLDAQYWGVPQRRRRICLVADFNGLNAPKIVFGEAEHNGSTKRSGGKSSVGHTGEKPRSKVQPVTQSLSGNPDESQQTRKATAGDAEGGSGADGPSGAIGCDIYNGSLSGDVAVSLTTAHCSTGTGPTVAVPYTLNESSGCMGGGKGALVQTDKSATLSTLQDQTLFQPVSIENHPADSHLVIAVDQGGGKSGAHSYEGVAPTLTCTHGGEPAVAYGIQGSMIGRADHNGPQGDGVNEDVCLTLNTTDRHAVAYGIDQQGGKGGANYSVDVSPPILSDSHGTPHAVVYGISPYHSNCMLSDNPHSGYYEADTARTLDALQCGYPGCNQGGMAVVEPLGFEMQAFGKYNCSGIASSLKARDCKDATDLVVAGVDCRNMNKTPELYPTLQAKSNGGQSLNYSGAVRIRYIVRRLTPLECERLQGFPDGWTDIGEWVDSKGKRRKAADSPRYEALGNSIAVPPWKWVLKRLCACYERDATMASLFDGIGGFPYIWEQINGKGSCLWASEIKEFQMAVTRLRFGGSDNG